MRIADYYHQILEPANVAFSALRRAGIMVDATRLADTRRQWEAQLATLERYVEGEAAKRGLVIRFSDSHHLPDKQIEALLYSANGLAFPVTHKTPGGRPSTDDEALARYASIMNPRPDDHPVVTAILKIRSLSKAIGTYLDSFARTRRADGACHPKFNWTLRTPRISAEDPPVHQIPERADREVADGIKSCLVPRVNPAQAVDDWNPRVHGSCLRWDISGAEAAIRAAMLPALFCARPDPVAWEYMRHGKDIHSKTASLIYRVPEGTYAKGSIERDAVGKQTFFTKIYGASWRTVQRHIAAKARIWLSDHDAQNVSTGFDDGYPTLLELYELDKRMLGERGFCEDGYGRRRWVGVPDGVKYDGVDSNGRTKWRVLVTDNEAKKALWSNMEHRFHIMANTPTQGMSATDAFWMIALAYHGEYVDLAVPPMWERRGLLFPEAADWTLHEGDGPGGKPFRAWHVNSVHDSGWLDCAPGYVEPLAKLLVRRCTALPFDWRLKADVPYRIDLSVGPDFAHLYDYDTVAKRFGLEPIMHLLK